MKVKKKRLLARKKKLESKVEPTVEPTVEPKVEPEVEKKKSGYSKFKKYAKSTSKE